MVILTSLKPLPAAAVALISDTEVASAGYFTLSWEADKQAIELQEADNAEFAHAKTLYRGQDSATLVSGKPDGQWFYRLRRLDSDAWSQTIDVEVAHHPLSRALAFLGVGILVFAAVAAVIVVGVRQTEDNGEKRREC